MRWARAFIFLAVPLPGLAATPFGLLGIKAGGDGLSVPMQIVILLTLMTLVPAAQRQVGDRLFRAAVSQMDVAFRADSHAPRP